MGHVLKYPLSKDSNEPISITSDVVVQWKDNLDRVSNVLNRKKKDLDFISVQIPLVQHIGRSEDIARLVTDIRTHYEQFQPTTQPAEEFEDVDFKEEWLEGADASDVAAAAAAAVTPKPRPPRSAVQFGIDLDSNFFVSSKGKTKSIGSSGSSSSSSGSVAASVISLLQPMVDAKQVSVITVACNAMTHGDARQVVEWGRGAGLETVATEVMRAHHYRPGSLPVSFDHAAKHSSVEGDTSKISKASAAARMKQLIDSSPIGAGRKISERERTRIGHIHEAVEDFKMALDRCLVHEKALLERLLPAVDEEQRKNVNVTKVCMAHVLLRRPDHFQYPEEWNHLVAAQVRIQFCS